MSLQTASLAPQNTPTTLTTSASHRRRRLLTTGTLAGASAMAATSVVAALARAADIGLEIDGKPIPLSAFAFWTFVGAGAGVVIAAIVRGRRRFLTTTLAATALSLVPSMIAPDDTATSVVLVGTHLVAAAIVIPVLSKQVRSG